MYYYRVSVYFLKIKEVNVKRNKSIKNLFNFIGVISIIYLLKNEKKEKLFINDFLSYDILKH